ncbi:hypothetical protein EG350_10445 [Chryseobacterium shandongense]|nr:hypothetical protein EG350_10445 [Chryseobacterium shandongense]
MITPKAIFIFYLKLFDFVELFVFIFIRSNLIISKSSIDFLFEAFSRFPLYLLGYGLRFAPHAPQKDVVSIGANKTPIFKKLKISR